MAFQNLEWHSLNALLVVEKLALVLRQEDLRQLAQSRCSSSINQRPDQEGLVYMAHAHPVFKKVDQFFVFHGGATMVVLFSESVATGSVIDARPDSVHWMSLSRETTFNPPATFLPLDLPSSVHSNFPAG